MSDRELMEFAARAVGYVPAQIYSEKTKSLIWASVSGFPTAWKPLVDNADAFELMVNLKMSVLVGDEGIRVNAPNLEFQLGIPVEEDLFSSTRKAIVMAAAEIGKKLEKANV